MAKLTNYEASKVRHAAEEIRHLRRRLEVAEARLSGFDSALALLHAVPGQGGGMAMGEDVAWALDRMVEVEPEGTEPGPAQPPKSADQPAGGFGLVPPAAPFRAGSVSGQATGKLHNQVEEPRRAFRADDAS